MGRAVCFYVFLSWVVSFGVLCNSIYKKLHYSYSLKMCHLHWILYLLLCFHVFQHSLNHIIAICVRYWLRKRKMSSKGTGEDTVMELTRKHSRLTWLYKKYCIVLYCSTHQILKSFETILRSDVCYSLLI